MTLAPFHPNVDRQLASRVFLVISLLAASAFGLLTISPGQASAAPEQGSFSMTLGTSKSGKALKRAGVKFSVVKPATQKRLKGKRFRITSTLKSSGKDTELKRLRGGIRFSKGKRKLVLRNLGLLVTSRPMKVLATVDGKPVTFFTTKTRANFEASTRTVAYKSSALKLTKRSARLIKSKLRVRRVPTGKVGYFKGSYQGAFEDPYFDLCGLPATSLTPATFPEAVDPPLLGDPVTTVGDSIEWGFKASFNGYVNGIGNIEVLDGASKLAYPGPPNAAAPPKAFAFVFQQGEYDANGAGFADDQAVLNGSGTVMYCNRAHGFRIAISDPTVVIDGASSRLIANVSTNISGDLKPSRRVHLADLDLSAATITEPEVGEVQWDFPEVRPTPQSPPTASAVTLSQDGSEALRLCEVSLPGAPPGCLYPPGTLLDELTVNAVFAQG
jgi:hypothetical protein